MCLLSEHAFKMSDFYLTLPSNNSMSQYPDNHGGHFYTKLPQSIDLSAMPYEVGLAEIQYSNTYANVKRDEAWLIYEADKYKGMQLVHVPEGLYSTAETLIESLNDLIRKSFSPMGSKDPKIKFFYNKSTKRATLKIYKKDDQIQLNPFLAQTLALTEDTMKGPGRFDGSNIMDVNKDSYAMYVYCDLVTHRPVGDTMVPLLRVVPTSSKGKDVVYKIFEKPHYLPIAKQQFDTIEILLSTDSGKIPSFASGKTVVTLHIRPRKYT